MPDRGAPAHAHQHALELRPRPGEHRDDDRQWVDLEPWIGSKEKRQSESESEGERGRARAMGGGKERERSTIEIQKAPRGGGQERGIPSECRRIKSTWSLRHRHSTETAQTQHRQHRHRTDTAPNQHGHYVDLERFRCTQKIDGTPGVRTSVIEGDGVRKLNHRATEPTSRFVAHGVGGRSAPENTRGVVACGDLGGQEHGKPMALSPMALSPMALLPMASHRLTLSSASRPSFEGHATPERGHL